jgi:hypothetical protein
MIKYFDSLSAELKLTLRIILIILPPIIVCSVDNHFIKVFVLLIQVIIIILLNLNVFKNEKNN